VATANERGQRKGQSTVFIHSDEANEFGNMLRSLNQALKQLMRRAGFDVSRFQPRTHPVAKKIDLMRRLGIDLVLDVGANIGQFAAELRRHGYRGRIISFEPLSAAYARLQKRTQADPLWEAKSFALGSADESQTIHISASNWSSSLLDVTETAVSAYPGSRTVASESIAVRRLDSIWPELKAEGAKVLLKIDTQGYEMHVLEGAVQSLARISMLQLEMSFAPLYEGQPLFEELYHWVQDRGFRLGSLEGVNWHPETGELLYLDGVFHRLEAPKSPSGVS
jgi:FkbM family methyltransferase